MTTELRDIFALVADVLVPSGVDCLLIGGFAVNHYGFTRNTLDVDLMIVAEKQDAVRSVLLTNGFTNMAVHDTVMFFQRPGSEWRIDFLKVDKDTMTELLADAEEAVVCGKTLKVPSVKNVIAMKLFSLAQSPARRMAKDLPDIAHLAVLNKLDVERDIHPLALRFASEDVFQTVANQIRLLQP